MILAGSVGMNLRQMTGHGQTSEKGQPAAPVPDRCLSLMVEGAALNMPEIDADTYRAFRRNVSQMAMQIPDHLPVEDKLAQIQKIVQEFESYRKGVEGALRERQGGWRELTTGLLLELLARVGLDPGSLDAAPLVGKIAGLATMEEIQAYSERLREFLNPAGAEQKVPRGASGLNLADHSDENLNAAGLRGGGAAVEHLARILQRGGSGFVVRFQLGCLDMIGERFGVEAVQDSLMAVAAFLTSSLRNDDAIYHWSDSSLLIILQSTASEQILTAAMRRIVDNNRDITVLIGGRSVMLRIPLEFDTIPISKLLKAEDLYKLSPLRAAKW